MIFNISESSASGTLPSGVIVMWSGASNAIPDGWHICDGTNGTPNLSGKFVLSSGSGYNIGNTGGEYTHTLTINEMPSHTHNTSISSGGVHSHSGTTNSAVDSHTHEFAANNGFHVVWVPSGNSSSSYACITKGRSSSTLMYTDTASNSHVHTFSTSSAGSHLHQISESSRGSGTAHNNMPPYYTLAYIMKL